MSAEKLNKVDDNLIILTNWIVKKDISSLLTNNNLEILYSNDNNLVIKGFSLNYSKLLNITIYNYQKNTKIFHKPSSSFDLPSGVLRILGLNNMKENELLKNNIFKNNAVYTSYTPLQIASYYNFPTINSRSLYGAEKRISGRKTILKCILIHFNIVFLMYIL